ncbi:MAG: F0F1 ATP synthase subunit epsilon [Chloroflexi bacterium]|nr:F0F1 ATP synthase subunit epsilon [Chloroflexota bacterium]
MPLTVEIVTAEREVYSQEGVDEVVAPGTDGEFAVLPQHAAFITTLMPGELRIIKGGEEEAMVITGGFFEVANDRIVVLADAAERVEEIDVERAEAARRQAEESLQDRQEVADLVQTETSLRRAVARLKVAQRRGRRGRSGPPRPGG